MADDGGDSDPPPLLSDESDGGGPTWWSTKGTSSGSSSGASEDGGCSDGSESSGDSVVVVATATSAGVGPRIAGTGQSVEERYGRGFVVARSVAAEAAAVAACGRTNKNVKRALWRAVSLDAEAQRINEARLLRTGTGCREWCRKQVEKGLRATPKSASAQQALNDIRWLRRSIVGWLRPRTKGGRCRKSWEEAKSFAVAGACETMLGLYCGKVRRCDMVWTRYLEPVLQNKLLKKEAGQEEEVLQAVRRVLALAVKGEGDGVIIYAVVPRKSAKWYVGQAHTVRKDRGAPTPGFPTRMCEHVAGSRGAAVGAQGPKYKLWKAIGIDAVLGIPLFECTKENEANSVEAWIISHDQPGANKKGRKVDRREAWKRRCDAMASGRRDFPNRRLPTTVREACDLNFWKLPRMQWKAMNDEWRLIPDDDSLRDRAQRKALFRKSADAVKPAATVDDPFREVYDEVVAKQRKGPVDMYAAGSEVLLCTYLARPGTPVVRCQMERLKTSQLFRMYNLAESAARPFIKRSLCAKVGYMLRLRGFPRCGRIPTKWEPGSLIAASEAKQIVHQELTKGAVSKDACDYWGSRLQWTTGVQKTYAQGGKNMRVVAQEFDMVEQRALSEEERRSARKDALYKLYEVNAHVPSVEEQEDATKRNVKVLKNALKDAKVPEEITAKVLARLEAEAKKRPLDPVDPVHKEFLAQFDVEIGEVTCTLDRNPKGMGSCPRRAYFAAMEDEYSDKFYYEIIEGEKEKAAALKKARMSERRHRPTWLQKRRWKGVAEEANMGFEYMNIKEKCLERDAAMSAKYGRDIYILTCPKSHSHWRCVSVQGRVPVGEIRSACRALTSLQAMDPWFHLNSRGLDSLGNQLKEEFDGLDSAEEFRCRCQRCGRKKDGACLLRADVSQQFKTITPAMVRTGVRGVGKRVKMRFRCSKITEMPSGAGRRKKTFVLSKGGVRRRGVRSWSFGFRGCELEQVVNWTAGHVLSRVGKHLLKRKRGVPMGSSISPIKASLALSEMEARAYQAQKKAEKTRFVQKNQNPRKAVSGARSADDITFLSKVMCEECLKKWAVFVYKKPLLLEWENQGKATIMCDRVMQIKAGPGNRGYLRVRRFDKNFDWVTGAEAARKRVRYLPPQVAPGQARLAQWVQARWIDEMNKNAGDEQYADVMVLYGLAGVAEHLCMGFGVSDVSKAVRRIRNPELQWLVRITRKWLERFTADFPRKEVVQREMWEMQRELRVE